MIINGRLLLEAAPIIDMKEQKWIFEGTSYGLSEAGYDIRLKQEVHYYPGEDGAPAELCVDGKYVEGNFTIASAIEEFKIPTNLVGIVHDKSSWARQGLSVFNTVIEPGWRGFLTLELVFHGRQNVHIPAGSGIAQIIFHETAIKAAYTGKYQDQADRPIPAIITEDNS